MNLENIKSNDPAISHYINEYQRIHQNLAGNNLAWLKQLREQALEQFATRGFPTSHDEEWKYTHVHTITKHNFSFANTEKNIASIKIPESITSKLDCHRLVFVDGCFANSLSQLPPKITISNLATALKEQPEFIQQHLAKNSTDNSFIMLNTSFINDGAYLHIPANTILDKPIELLFIATANDDLHFNSIRNLIIADENSQAIIFENYLSLNKNYHFTNVVTELVLNKRAHIEHYKLLQENEHAFHISNLNVTQKERSCFTSHSLTLSGLLVRSDTTVTLEEEFTDCTLNGLYLARGKQHVDHHTSIEHKKPHGTSHEFYKGVIGDRARAVFNGKVLVQPNAHKTNARQTNNNLLLSQEAEIDTKPQLEIYNDDVQCAHGATVGQLDENAMFYLRSRGLPEDIARNTLIYAFIREIIERMPLISSAEQIEKYLSKFIVT